MQTIVFEHISQEAERNRIEFLRGQLDQNGDTCSMVFWREDVLVRIRICSFTDLNGGKHDICVKDALSVVEAIAFINENEEDLTNLL